MRLQQFTLFSLLAFSVVVVRATMWDPRAFDDSASQSDRFLINGEMVIDTYTGLFWELNIAVHNATFDAEAGEGSGQHYCQHLRAGGFADWRLPTPQEGQTIVDFTRATAPYIDMSVFKSMTSIQTMTVQVQRASNLGTGYWFVDFSDGFVWYTGPETAMAVRCLRGSTWQPLNRFTAANGTSLSGNEAETLDRQTMLVWQRADNSFDQGALTWPECATYCSQLTIGGYSNWRLPQVKELLSIADFSTSWPSANLTAFPNTGEDGWHFTSTTRGTTAAFYVGFDVGASGNTAMTDPYWVRCVRSF